MPPEDNQGQNTNNNGQPAQNQFNPSSFGASTTPNDSSDQSTSSSGSTPAQPEADSVTTSQPVPPEPPTQPEGGFTAPTVGGDVSPTPPDNPPLSMPPTEPNEPSLNHEHDDHDSSNGPVVSP